MMFDVLEMCVCVWEWIIKSKTDSDWECFSLQSWLSALFLCFNKDSGIFFSCNECTFAVSNFYTWVVFFWLCAQINTALEISAPMHFHRCCMLNMVQFIKSNKETRWSITNQNRKKGTQRFQYDSLQECYSTQIHHSYCHDSNITVLKSWPKQMVNSLFKMWVKNNIFRSYKYTCIVRLLFIKMWKKTHLFDLL